MEKSSELDNQQEIPSQADIGWLAGIIDGEGSLTMHVRKKGQPRAAVDLHFWVVNTDAGIIEKFIRITTALGISTYINERATVTINGYNSGKKILACGTAKLGSIHKLVTILEPHLAGEKAARCRLIRRFIEERWANGNKLYREYTNKDWQVVIEFAELVGGKTLERTRELLTDYTRTAQDAKPEMMI